jgi:ketosteroid isomerase-like protein
MVSRSHWGQDCRLPADGRTLDKRHNQTTLRPANIEVGAMEELDAFLTSTMPQLKVAETALHNGYASPRIAMWSHQDPVTLFGTVTTKTGWEAIRPTFDWLASTFSNCMSAEYEVLAAGTSGDLAYVVGIEHTTASLRGGPPTYYSLRVTTIFRREDGAWKVVHRHGDPYDSPTGEVLAELS